MNGLRRCNISRYALYLAVAFGLNQQSLAQGTQYTLTERSPLGGHTGRQVLAINSSGQAVGYDLDTAGNEHPVFWEKGHPSALPLPAIFASGRATGINRFGQPVGILYDKQVNQHAVKWNLSMTSLSELRPPQGTVLPAAANAINDEGEVAGTAVLANIGDPTLILPILWTGNTAVVLPTGSADVFGQATAVNAGGVAVGHLFGGSSSESVFESAARWNGTALTGLGDLGGRRSEATAISDTGWIAGWSETQFILPIDTSTSHAVLWKGNTVAIDLGTLQGVNGYSVANGINNSGQVVGDSGASDGRLHAMLWQNGAMIDLNRAAASALPKDTVLTHANAIADDGEIDVVAVNKVTNLETDYLLTPHYPTSTTVVTNTNPAIFGQNVTFKVAVKSTSGERVTGVVELKDGGRKLGAVTLNSSARTAFTTSTLLAGAHRITATYGGSERDLPSESAVLREQVAPAKSATTLVSSHNPAAVGQRVSFTATVHIAGGAITGRIFFRDGTKSIGSVAVGPKGTARLATETLPVGTHDITAIYSGDSNVKGSRSRPLVQVVSARSN